MAAKDRLRGLTFAPQNEQSRGPCGRSVVWLVSETTLGRPFDDSHNQRGSARESTQKLQTNKSGPSTAKRGVGRLDEVHLMSSTALPHGDESHRSS